MHNPPVDEDQPKADKYGLVHRDLKPENILLVDSDDSLPEIKLIDFGTAKKFQYYNFNNPALISSGTIKYPIGLKEKVGTLNYMAPEIMALESGHNKKEDPTGQSLDDYKKHFYSEKVDVWSIGVIAYVLLTGKSAFNDNLPTKALMEEIKGFIEDPLSDEWKKKQENDKSSKPHIFEEQVFTRLPEMVRNFVKACMHRNPDKRSSCE